MPRPCKRRRICGLPSCRHFGPKDIRAAGGQPIIMTFDELETIRLIDLEGLKQEECAGQMKIARTTAQAIYNSARTKLAECLINGKELTIAGGNYELCDGSGLGCIYGCCCRHKLKNDAATNDTGTDSGQGKETM
jgi:uncharacterized protein